MISERINARLPEALATHVARVVGPNGLYETPSEYIRALIRQDYERNEAAKWERLVDELKPGLEASPDAFVEVSAEDVIKRGRQRRGK